MKKKEEARSRKKYKELSATSNNIVVIYSDLRKVAITHFAIKYMLLEEQNGQPQLYYNYTLYNYSMSLSIMYFNINAVYKINVIFCILYYTEHCMSSLYINDHVVATFL